MSHVFPPDERAAFYRMIESDATSAPLRSDPIPEDILLKISGAAHHAPSVGLMQPWNFIRDPRPGDQARVHALFLQENEVAAANYEGHAPRSPDAEARGDRERAGQWSASPATGPGRPHVLGRNTIIDTTSSAPLRDENLWLAARVEASVWAGPVILDNDELRAILGIPTRWCPSPISASLRQDFLD